MKINKFKPITLIIISSMLWFGFVQAQESIHSAGADATGSDGSVAFSVGQVAYTSNTATSGKVSQGVQQAYEIFTVGIKQTKLDISLSVFPNPTSNHLILEINDFKNEKFSYQLYDIQGKLINTSLINAKQMKIDMYNLAAATYLVDIVSQDNQKIQSFKIVKIN